MQFAFDYSSRCNDSRSEVICLDQKPDRFPPESETKELLLAFLPGLVTLLVGLIVRLFLGLLVMIVQIAAGGAGDR
ncbi:hypothetical protein D1AOALGA4SA_9978, partial [Olavius algarvensis Delta 1 endosymbiont]